MDRKMLPPKLQAAYIETRNAKVRLEKIGVECCEPAFYQIGKDESPLCVVGVKTAFKAGFVAVAYCGGEMPECPFEFLKLAEAPTWEGLYFGEAEGIPGVQLCCLDCVEDVGRELLAGKPWAALIPAFHN